MLLTQNKIKRCFGALYVTEMLQIIIINCYQWLSAVIINCYQWLSAVIINCYQWLSAVIIDGYQLRRCTMQKWFKKKKNIYIYIFIWKKGAVTLGYK